MASGKDNELPLSHRKDEKAVLLFYEAGFDVRRMLAMRRFFIPLLEAGGNENKKVGGMTI